MSRSERQVDQNITGRASVSFHKKGKAKATARLKKRSQLSQSSNSDLLTRGEAHVPTEAHSWSSNLVSTFLVWSVTFTLTSAAQWEHIYDDVPGGDSGELLAEACLLGVAHPPGYPLFILFTHTFMKLTAPWLSSAKAANLASVLCGSGASGFVSLSILLWPRPSSINCFLHIAVSIMAGVAFSMSPLVWSYTVGAEVFALNNLLCSILIFLTVLLSRKQEILGPKRTQTICFGAFVCGLGMSNQHTSILFQVPLVFYVVFWLDRPWNVRRWIYYGVAGLAGLSPYLYLYISAGEPKIGSWGATDTLPGLLRHFFRQEYGTMTLSGFKGFSEGFVERSWAYIQDLVLEQTIALPLAAPALVVGGAMTSIRNSHLGIALLLAFVFYFAVFHSLANLPLSMSMSREVHRRFWIQPHLIICVWLGLGAIRSSEFLEKQASRMRIPLLVLVGLATLALISKQVATNDINSHSYLIGAYADTLLASLPTGALLVSHTDMNWNSVRFKQACQGKRPDVTHLSFQMMPYPWFHSKQAPLYPNVTFPKLPKHGMETQRGSETNSQMVVQFCRSNAVQFKGEVFIDLHSLDDSKLGPDNSYPGGIFLVPHGIVWKVFPLEFIPTRKDSSEPNHILIDDVWLDKWRHESRAHLNPVLIILSAVPKANRIVSGTWEYAALCILWDSVYQRALFLLSAALQRDYSSPFYASGLKESVDLLSQVVLNVKVTETISVSVGDVAKNAALASIRWLQYVGTHNPQDALTAEKTSFEMLTVFETLGDSSDPIYDRFIAILEALRKRESSHF
mmetsp:Transcript_21791/g.42884  ORF Transcript_21791/g.42884 Transcript_21791/m.42884 type:complete len:794 (+) Transcript_21791:80-2461(+)